MGMIDPLNPTHLCKLIQTLFPRSTTSPLPRPTDAVAILIHAIHTSLDFRLVRANPPAPSSQPDLIPQPGDEEIEIDDEASETATAVNDQDQDQNIETDASGGSGSVSVSSGKAGSNAPSLAEARLDEGWNSRGESVYEFQYRHAQSAMVFHVRVGRIGGRVQIDAMAEDNEPHTVTVLLNDLLTISSFPIPSAATASAIASTSSTPETALGFRSTEDIAQFVRKYDQGVIARLIPGLQKEGYRQPPAPTAGSNTSTSQHRQPLAPSPANPSPLIDPSLHAPPSAGSNPASVGRRDLDPLAAFRPPLAGNSPLAIGPDRGGGNYVDFNHPLFDGRRPRDPDLDGPGGLVQPPGARWDPVGPMPGGSGGGARFPGPGGNPLGGVGRGDREWGDELPPPGEFGPDLGMGMGRGRGGLGGMGGIGGLGGPGGMGGYGGPGGLGGGRFGGSGRGGFGGAGGGMFL